MDSYQAARKGDWAWMPRVNACDDGNDCTNDICNAVSGCEHYVISDCCDNGNCESGENQCNCSENCGVPSLTENDCSDGIDSAAANFLNMF